MSAGVALPVHDAAGQVRAIVGVIVFLWIYLPAYLEHRQ